MDLDRSLRIENCTGVYAPSDDTNLLLSAIRAGPGERMLEMGCGTGIVALHCAKARCIATAADISPDAVACARGNARANGLDISIIQSDLFGSVEGEFDVIAFNPPYLSLGGSEGLTEEERRPLVGGTGGHELTVRFLNDAGRFLAPGGRIYLLTSSESEAGAMEAARRCFIVKKVAELRIFFETLAVWKLRLAKH